MKNHIRFLGVTVGLVILSTGLAFLLFSYPKQHGIQLAKKVKASAADPNSMGSGVASPNIILPNASVPLPASTPLSASQKAKLRNGLKAIFAKLRPPAVEEAAPMAYLELAATSGNKADIIRAFDHTIYLGTMSEVIPALRFQLKNADPFVRYIAAQHLLMVGDDSGLATMISLVRTNSPISGVGKRDDLRDNAAHVLAQYHQTSAIDAISSLYLDTHSAETSLALSNLGVALPDEDRLAFVPSETALEQYAKCGDTQFIPQITVLFHNTNETLLKAAAAWSLATLIGDVDSTNYLIEQAHVGLDIASQNTSYYNIQMVKYVGTIQVPTARQTLELALESSDPSIVETAIVNLLYNQGGSDKALHILADQISNNFHGKPLSTELVYSLVAKFGNSEIIQNAAKDISERGAYEHWKRFVIDRKNWSSYNWIDRYVIKLNH